MKEAVVTSGAKAGDVQSTGDAQGIRHSKMQVSYRADQPEIGKISHTIDAIGQQSDS